MVTVSSKPNLELSDKKKALLKVLLSQKDDGSDQTPSILRRANNAPSLLSFAQQRLWFLEQLFPGSDIHNISEAFELKGNLKVEALKQSLNEIIKRHEALRTNFVLIGESPFQVVAEERKLDLSVVDLSDLPEEKRQNEMKRLLSEESRLPFHLDTDLLVRVLLLRLAQDHHVLMLTVHHIVSDDWSMDILFQELTSLYEAVSSGEDPDLLPLPIQYPDFAIWQRGWLQGNVLSSQLSYWKKKLENRPLLLALPTDHPRPSVQSYRGNTISFEISPSLSASLKEISRREGVTLFMTLLAVFKVLLFRHTGQRDLLVATPIAGRNRSETEDLIGFFVNTLVLRTNVTGGLNFRELLARVKNVALEAYGNQDLPFEKLVEELHPERDLSHSPLFQVMFVYHNEAGDDLVLPNLAISPLDLDSGTSQFDLTLTMMGGEDELSGSFEFSTDLFEERTVLRMKEHFEILLKGVVADPNLPLWKIPMLTEAERRQIVLEWNQTEVELVNRKCFHQLFEEQVEKSPGAIAVVFRGQEISYKSLNERANQLAHYLQEIGVGPESLVGICMERSVEMLVGILGILKAGGCYLPLDPTYPVERLSFILEDSGAKILLTQDRLVGKLPKLNKILLSIDKEWDTIRSRKKENVVSDVTEANLAYVIYTSGSTGKPKGTMISHRALVNYLVWAATNYKVQEGDGSIVHSPIGFDLTVSSLFLPLLVGKKLLLIEEGGLEALRSALSSVTDCSFIKVTPAHLEALNQLLPPAEAAGRMRAMIIGGEALPGEAVAFWQTNAQGTELYNEYGPTEATVGCCVYKVPPTRTAGSVPIGRPIMNTQLYILDRRLEPVTIGVPGELYIGGEGLARGYLNRSEMTASSFIPNPFSRNPGDRLYRTGDIARYLSDGNLEFLGRLDDQVKIRGFRIEPGEVESALRQHARVAEAAVVVREDDPGNKLLVGYVVSTDERTFSQIDLRDFLKVKLPEYMIPSHFVSMKAFPLTPNGKVDRSKLPSPDPNRDGKFLAPRNRLEEELAEIWREVLRNEKIGIDDNFFEIGGHSMLAVRLFVRIEQLIGKNLPLATLFQAPTVRQMAKALLDEGWNPPWSSSSGDST